MVNEVNIIIIHCPIRSGHFGMNTYVNNLINIFEGETNFRLTKIFLDDPDSKIVNSYTKNDITFLKIPRPFNNAVLRCSNDFNQIYYAKRIVDIIEMYFNENSVKIFWFNLTDHINVATELKNRFACKLIYTHHNWAWKNNYTIDYNYFTFLWNNNRSFFSKEIINYTAQQFEFAQIADVVITLTNGSKYLFEEILKVTKHKIYVIPNFLPIYNKSALTNEEVKLKYGIPLEKQIALFAGRITDRKGIFIVIDAFKKILSRRNDIIFIIIGDGEIDRVIKEVNPFWTSFLLTGELPKEQLVEFYKIADIGLLVSLQEQSSYSALEMRMFKIPMIISDVEGLGETFENGIDCIKIPISYNQEKYLGIDSDSVMNAIDLLLDDKILCSSISEFGYTRYVDKYSFDNGKREYLRIIDNVL